MLSYCVLLLSVSRPEGWSCSEEEEGGGGGGVCTTVDEASNPTNSPTSTSVFWPNPWPLDQTVQWGKMFCSWSPVYRGVGGDGDSVVVMVTVLWWRWQCGGDCDSVIVMVMVTVQWWWYLKQLSLAWELSGITLETSFKLMTRIGFLSCWHGNAGYVSYW